MRANKRRTIMLRTRWWYSTAQTAAKILRRTRGEASSRSWLTGSAGPTIRGRNYPLARIYLQMPDAKSTYCARQNMTCTTDVATGTRPCHKNIVEWVAKPVRMYGMPTNRVQLFVFSSLMWCGNAVRKEISSEFGMPRRSVTAWRARGPPMAVTETGTQIFGNSFPAPLVRAALSYQLAFFEPWPLLHVVGLSRPLLTVGRVTYYCVFVPHVQPARNRYRMLGDLYTVATVIGAHNGIQYAGPRLPSCIIVFSYGWLICLSVARCKRRTRTNKTMDGGRRRLHSSPPMS